MGKEPSSGGRSAEAIQAAVEVAAAFGVQVKESVLLRSTNNTVVWFRPTVIVATEVSVTTEDWQTNCMSPWN